jgi:hypothetical protein
MSNIYPYSYARQNLASLLDEAARDGEVKLRRKDGSIFVIQPEKKIGSPFDVPTVALQVTTVEIVQFVRESRRE